MLRYLVSGTGKVVGIGALVSGRGPVPWMIIAFSHGGDGGFDLRCFAR